MPLTIRQQVYEKYPVTEREKDCLQEQTRMQYLRKQYKKRLEQQAEHKRNSSDTAQVRG